MNLLELTHPWETLAGLNDRDIPLFAASLLIAKDEYPNLDTPALFALLADYRKTLRGELSERREAVEKLQMLNQFLFEREGYSGNFLDYYNPRNSYLSDVLVHKLGIPISLAVVYLEAARGLGVELQGISFPGHFLVRLEVPGGLVVLDPFNRGKSISTTELKFRARGQPSGASSDQHSSKSLRSGYEESTEGEDPSESELFAMLTPCSNRAILVRMLHNLKALYQQQQDFERALRIANRLVQLQPRQSIALRDRGILYAKLGAHHAARTDLSAYLQAEPAASDALEVQQALVSSVQHSQSARLN